MQKEGIDNKPYLMPGEVAELFGVTPGTIRNWVKAKLLSAVETAGGHRRFARRDVMAFAGRHGLRPSAASPGILRVLIVDDDPQVVRFLERRLESLPVGTVSDVAHDGFDAGRKVTDFDPDLVLLDLYMDGLDGFEVCRRLKSDPLTRSIRVIAITGRRTAEIAERIVGLGAEACLAKPVDKQALLEAIGQE